MLRLLFTLILCLSSALAEQPARGRLPDGRSFRTDVDGSEIVDYIAELEVTIEESDRRILALENEVAAQKKSNAPIKEKSLLAVDEAPPAAPQKIKCAADDCAEICGKDQDKLAKLSADLEDAKIDLGIQEKTYQAETAKLEKEIKTLSGRLASFTRGPDTEEEEDDMRAAFIFNPPRDEKKQVLQEISAVRQTINRRNAMFSEFQGNSKNIALKPTPAVSSQNNSVDTIASRLQRAEDEEIEALREEITEIHERMVDDMALITRMRKLP